MLCLLVCALGMPHRTHAESWEYLFTDLSWPEESPPLGNGGWAEFVGSYAGGSAGNQETGSYFDYLFADLTWPEESSPVSSDAWDAFIGDVEFAGMGTSMASSGYWDFLLEGL